MGRSLHFIVRRVPVPALLVALALPAFAGTAGAVDNPADSAFAPLTGGALTADPMSSTGVQTIVGGSTPRLSLTPGATAHGTTTGGRPSHAKLVRNGRRCAVLGRRRTCTTYRNGKAIKICTKVGSAKTKCHKPRSRRALTGAFTANIGEGWYAGDAPMGRIWLTRPGEQPFGECTGTVVGTNIVLTAGHCLYPPDLGGQPVTNLGSLFFAPKNQFAANGGTTEAENSSLPYGSWVPSRILVPDCWTQTFSLLCDVGLMVMAPDAQGRLVGDVVGSYKVAANVTGVTVGTQVNNAGYPGEAGFASYQNGMGNAPYYCNNTLTAGSGLLGGFDGTDTGAFLQTVNCPMTGGASGGPVYIKLTDNQWYIFGVNNQADFRILKTDFSTLTGFQPFGDAFLTLWNDVISGRR